MRIPTVLKTLLGVAGAAAVLGTAHGQATAPPAAAAAPAAATAKLSKADQKILTDMAQGNMAEIAIAKVAQAKGRSEQVKTFSQQMIDDHARALAEVQQVAGAKGVTLPAELDKKHQARVDKLAAASDDAFDRSYMQLAGVADHKKMHSMLVTARSSAKDPDVKALAAKMLPTVDQHLKAAQQMAGAKGAAKDARPPADTAAGK